MKRWTTAIVIFTCVFYVRSQGADKPADRADFPPPGTPPFDGPPRFTPEGNRPGGPGGPMQPEIKLVGQFDKDGDKGLNSDERKSTREYIVRQRADEGQRGWGGRRGGPGGPGGRGERVEPGRPGPQVSPDSVKTYPNSPLYASNVVRTLFLEFGSGDWEKELEDFHNTDVELPAKLTVDGKVYSDVGVHFRGASSYKMIPNGSKRSLNVALDFAHKDQNLLGYRTLNLLNVHEDPSFVRAVLYSDIARAYIPAPAANFVRVVINGESWGVYVSLQQFNKDFVKDWFGTTQGARWKVPGSPRGRGSLAYLGDNAEDYKRIYEIKSKDEPAAWSGLIRLRSEERRVGKERRAG